MSTKTLNAPVANPAAAMLAQFKAKGAEQENRTVFGTPINQFLDIHEAVDASAAMTEAFSQLNAVHEFASAWAGSINELIAKRTQPNIWREAINELG